MKKTTVIFLIAGVLSISNLIFKGIIDALVINKLLNLALTSVVLIFPLLGLALVLNIKAIVTYWELIEEEQKKNIHVA